MYRKIAPVGLTILLLLAGCSENTTDNSLSAGDGRLKLYLTDAPASYDAVNVNVLRVEVHRSGMDSTSGWSVIESQPATYDLIQLRNGAMAVMGDTSLPAGSYTQIRLILGEGCTVVVDGVPHDLSVPSGPQTGIKLNTPFVIEAGKLYELTLDFDADKSIHRTGNGQYKMSPVIRVQATAISGEIEGVVLPAAAKPLVRTIVGTDEVSAVADSLTGRYRFVALPEGVYALSFSSLALTHRDTTVTGILVTAQETTAVDTMWLQPQ